MVWVTVAIEVADPAEEYLEIVDAAAEAECGAFEDDDAMAVGPVITDRAEY
jgi:hypothetical protein